MACGLCVISTNVSGIPYLLTHEEDALLVPADDPCNMTTAVKRTLGYFARCSSRGLPELMPSVSIDRRIAQWTSLLRALATLLSDSRVLSLIN
jgi:glycosyltransferase involved in cell wall biosynthesis